MRGGVARVEPGQYRVRVQQQPNGLHCAAREREHLGTAGTAGAEKPAIRDAEGDIALRREYPPVPSALVLGGLEAERGDEAPHGAERRRGHVGLGHLLQRQER